MLNIKRKKQEDPQRSFLKISRSFKKDLEGTF